MIELLIVTQSGIDAKIENGVFPPWLKLSEIDGKKHVPLYKLKQLIYDALYFVSFEIIIKVMVLWIPWMLNSW